MTVLIRAQDTQNIWMSRELPGCVLAWTHVRWCFPLCNLQSGGAISSCSVVPGDQNHIWSQCHGQERSLEAKLQVKGGGGVVGVVKLQPTSTDMRRTCNAAILIP